MYQTAVDKLRQKALKLYRVHETIQVLLGMVTVDVRKRLEHNREAINQANKRRLNEIINELEQRIESDRKEHGIKVPNSLLVKYLVEANAQKGWLLMLPKYAFEELIPKFHLLMPDFVFFPEHLKIAIDPGIYRTKEGDFELYLIEAILYEDMCALFNLAREHSMKEKIDSPKKIVKIGRAFLHSTVTTAYYFVEAYLNGIAFDYYFKNKDILNEESRSLLTEWDYRADRPKYISFRDKLVKYPRIILGVQHSPLQPNNCSEMEFIATKAKILRDSIVHSSPALDLKSIEMTKEKEFFQIDIGDAEEIVDKSITLVKKIEMAVFGNDKRLFWLRERGADGFFSDDVFI
jgi:hypothetical protein